MVIKGVRGRTIITVSLALTVGLMLLALSLNERAAAQTVLFNDNLEDGNSAGWTIHQGSWAVATDGTRVFQQSNRSSKYRAAAGASSWTNYTVQARVKPLSFNGTDRAVSLLARFRDGYNHYSLSLRSNNQLRISRLAGGTSTTLAETSFTVSTGTWYTLRFEVAGSTLRGSVNGVQISATDTRFPTGQIGASTDYATGAFDDFIVTAGVGGPLPTPTPTPIRPPTPTPTPIGNPTPTPTPIGNPTPTPTPGNPPQGLIGFATLNTLGQNSTTGGAGGATVTATSAAQFLDFIARPEPLIIRVSGTISLPGPMHNVASNKSILGVGSNSGITGGGLNIGLTIDDDITSPPANAIKNVIVRNLNISDCPDDCINVQMFSHHIWIDHNDISRQNDGALDIKRGSDYITVSWNHFHDSDKNMLLGHDDGAGAQDIGRLKVTYHHNFFNGSKQRNPRVRFGEPVHVFNNYYLNNTGYGVASQMNAGVLVEGNYFNNTTKPTRTDVGGDPGRVVQRNNIFVDSDPPVNAGSVIEPRTFYNYTLDPAANVPSIVQAGAGVGKIGL